MKEIPIISEAEHNLLIGLQAGCPDEVRIVRSGNSTVYWDSDFDGEETQNTRLPFRMFMNLLYGYHYTFSELTGENWRNYAYQGE